MTDLAHLDKSHLDAPSRGTLGRLERGKETRRSLIRTAARLWSERGFDAVTVEEICSAAGVGRTTFYLHFENKEQLLASLASGTSLGVTADLDALDAGSTIDERLDVFVRGVVRRMESVPKSMAELVIHSWHVQQLKARTEGRETHLRFADLLRSVLVDGRRRGELAADADPAELGEILGALTMDAIEAWASGRAAQPSLEAVLRSRFALIVDPFRTERV